jgi:xanthine dehydrogenase iron-sulfur cluster and FAD-binding subunit A
MANELTLSVNGAKQVVSATPETPLLFVLRNELKLTGPRLGCGMAQCGANPERVFDLVLPLHQVAEGYRAMDERRAIKALLRT